MSPHVFISYAREDAVSARRVCRDLAEYDLQVWFDEDSLVAGQDWLREIKLAINQTELFVVLLSQHSVTKKGVIQREIREALNVAQTLPEGQVFRRPCSTRRMYSLVH